jgi:DNA-binding beta-propeller fold protein YncE
MTLGFLVDAYNLFYAARSSPHSRLIPNLKRMAYLLEHFASRQHQRVVMVVDGTRYCDEFVDTELIKILCSEGGKSADAVMEAWMAGLAASERLGWALVTNDLNLSRMGAGMGLRVRPCESLIADLAAFARAEEKPAEPKRNPNFGRPFNNPFGSLMVVLTCLILSTAASAAEFDGFLQPTAVAYDPAADSYYVTNLNPSSDENSSGGFVSKIAANGLVVIQKFIQGSSIPGLRRLSAPNGIAVSEGKIFITDTDTIHIYKAGTGEASGVIKFRPRKPAALSGIAMGQKGILYVGDTQSSVIYQIDTRAGNAVKVFLRNDLVRNPTGLWFDTATASLFVITGKGALFQVGRHGKTHLIRKGLGRIGGLVGDESGALYLSEIARGEVYRIKSGGRGDLSQVATGLRAPAGLGYDTASGALLISQSAAGRVTTVILPRVSPPFIPKNKSKK